MSTMTKRSTFLTVRLDTQTAQEFRTRATRYGGVSEVLREMIEAFLDERLVVRPPKQPKKESLYVTRSED